MNGWRKGTLSQRYNLPLIAVLIMALIIAIAIVVGAIKYTPKIIDKIKNYRVQTTIEKIEAEKKRKAELEEQARKQIEESKKIVEELERIETKKKNEKAEREKSERENRLIANTEYSKMKYPVGTYVKNLDTQEIARVKSIEGLILHTDSDWVFGVEDENISYASYGDYARYRKAQNKLIYKAEQERLEAESIANKPVQEKYLKTLFATAPVWYYVKLKDGTYGKGKKYDGLYLKLKDGRRVWYEDAKSVTYYEYCKEWEDKQVE